MLSLAEYPVTELSGGERQRVAVARAFAQESPLLMLDEPCANLDLRHAHDLLACVRSRIAGGAAGILALHDLNLAARFADRVVLLSQGRIEALGTAVDVLTAERIRHVFAIDAEIIT